MTRSSLTTHRPRLEPGQGPGVGPGPLSPLWRAAPEPERSAHPIAMLHRELRGFRHECWAALRAAADGVGLSPIARNDIDWLNQRLTEVQRLDAGLAHHSRSPAIATWPTPPLPTGVLFGPRELVGPLGEALRALVAIAARHEVSLDD